MVLGLIVLLVTAGIAGYLLLRLARGDAASRSVNMTLIKVVAWLGLVGVLFTVRLWPLAFMVLAAAFAVMMIEMWRDRTVKDEEARHNNVQGAPASRIMTVDEAAAILDLAVDASTEEVRAAHRKLIAQLHPDKGGTDYLAAQINRARDTLLAED